MPKTNQNRLAGKMLVIILLCSFLFTACVPNPAAAGAAQAAPAAPAPAAAPTTPPTPAASVTAASALFTNPLNTSGPDPWMTYYNGNYYLAATTGGQNLSTGLTMRKAPTIARLKMAEPEKIWQDANSMNCCNYWAPEFFLLNGFDGPHWYGYFTGGPSSCCDYQHMSVIESVGTDPMGPYTLKARLDDKFDRWAIDASILQLDGKLYLLFSAFTNGKVGDGTQNLYIAPMSNPWTLSGARVLISTPTFAWETATGPVNEGPVALQHDGKTFIIYSGNGCWGPNYALGLLTYQGGDPLLAAAWKKSPQPVFKGSGTVFAPGHNTFFKSPDGTEDWITYHANTSAAGVCDDKRSPRIQKMDWNSDGTPNLGDPVALTQSLSVPSGEKAP